MKRIEENKKANSALPSAKPQYNFYPGSGNDINSQYGIDCEKCNNSGFIAYKDKQGIEHYMRCACFKTWLTKKRLKESGLSGVIDRYTFDNFKVNNDLQKVIKEMALKFLEASDSWFYIGGQSGGGKTHICTALCNKLISEKNKSLEYITWVTWAERVNMAKRSSDSEEQSKLFDRCKNVDVLYIDDLFKNGKDKNGNVTPPTSAEIKKAFEILDYRDKNKLTTIISSEYTIMKIIDYDQAVGGRIVERCGGFIININSGESNNYRLNRR